MVDLSGGLANATTTRAGATSTSVAASAASAASSSGGSDGSDDDDKKVTLDSVHINGPKDLKPGSNDISAETHWTLQFGDEIFVVLEIPELWMAVYMAPTEVDPFSPESPHLTGIAIAHTRVHPFLFHGSRHGGGDGGGGDVLMQADAFVPGKPLIPPLRIAQLQETVRRFLGKEDAYVYIKGIPDYPSKCMLQRAVSQMVPMRVPISQCAAAIEALAPSSSASSSSSTTSSSSSTSSPSSSSSSSLAAAAAAGLVPESAAKPEPFALHSIDVIDWSGSTVRLFVNFTLSLPFVVSGTLAPLTFDVMTNGIKMLTFSTSPLVLTNESLKVPLQEVISATIVSKQILQMILNYTTMYDEFADLNIVIQGSPGVNLISDIIVGMRINLGHPIPPRCSGADVTSSVGVSNISSGTNGKASKGEDASKREEGGQVMGSLAVNTQSDATWVNMTALFRLFEWPLPFDLRAGAFHFETTTGGLSGGSLSASECRTRMDVRSPTRIATVFIWYKATFGLLK